MKQKLVIKVSMNDQKSRTKALKVAVSCPGIESAAIIGTEKDQLELKGDGFDVVDLTTLLRKKVGFAEIVSVSPAEEKKEAPKPPAAAVAAALSPQPVFVPNWPYNASSGYSYHYQPQQYQDPCSIM